MDYEKYNNALEKARLRYNEIKDTNCSEEKFLLDLFPELKESEDERIRKGIIDFLWKEKIFLQEAHSSVENNPKYRFVMDAIAWLEKQGEHDETSIAIKNPEAYRIGFADGEAHAKEEMNTLSDEDKMMLNELIIGFYGYKDQYPNFWKMRTDEIIEWLKKKKDEHTTDNG